MFNVVHLIQAGGLVVVAAIIFAESGMMVGFLFPGDTLLLSAGVLAASGKLSLMASIIVIACAAIAGDNVGFHIGQRFGRKLFRKTDGIVFRHEYIMKAEEFYKRYGSKTMLVAHFVPIVRTFAPVTAGAGNMPLGKFMLFDAIGDIAWSVILTSFGFFVGSRIPGIDRFIEPLLILVVVVFLVPTLYHIVKDPRIRSALTKAIRRS